MQDVFCFAALANTITGTMYTDITGAFPVCLFKGMQYIFVAYVNDLSAIIVRAMPSCTDASMVTAFTEVIPTLKARGYHLTLNVMDNECSATVKKYIRSENISIHLVPLHNHQVNAVEQAITTFKDHFIAALATAAIALASAVTIAAASTDISAAIIVILLVVVGVAAATVVSALTAAYTAAIALVFAVVTAIALTAVAVLCASVLCSLRVPLLADCCVHPPS